MRTHYVSVSDNKDNAFVALIAAKDAIIMKKTAFLLTAAIAVSGLSTNISAPQDMELNEGLVVSAEMQAEAQAEIDAIDLEARFDNIDWDESSVKINEYELLDEMEHLSPATLRTRGLTNAEISDVQNFREVMAEQIYELGTLDEAALIDKGYTDGQINGIQNFDGSETSLKALSASANVTMEIDYCEYNISEDRTYSRVYFAWEWDGVPAFKLTDVMAVVWNDWTLTGKAGYVEYDYIYGGSSKSKPPTYIDYDGKPGYGAGYKFSAALDDNYYYAQNGYCIFVVNTVQHRDMHVKGSLVHSLFQITPTFRVTINGAVPELDFGFLTDVESATASMAAERIWAYATL